MRTFYIFKIKEEYATLTEKNPYQLFHMLDFIYTLDISEASKGADLFYKIVDRFDEKKLDTQLLKKYQEDYFYTKFKNMHQVHNYYKEEETKLMIKKHYLLLKSSVMNPVFLNDLKEIHRLFLCDFENKDYFWLDKLAV